MESEPPFTLGGGGGGSGSVSGSVGSVRSSGGGGGGMYTGTVGGTMNMNNIQYGGQTTPGGYYNNNNNNNNNVQMVSLQNEQVVVRKAGRQAIRQFLDSHTCFAVLRTSGKVVVFDIRIPIQLAFYALVEHDILAAPLWDPVKCQFVGLLTVTDFIDLLRFYRTSEKDVSQLAECSIAEVLSASWEQDQLRKQRQVQQSTTATTTSSLSVPTSPQQQHLSVNNEHPDTTGVGTATPIITATAAAATGSGISSTGMGTSSSQSIATSSETTSDAYTAATVSTNVAVTGIPTSIPITTTTSLDSLSAGAATTTALGTSSSIAPPPPRIPTLPVARTFQGADSACTLRQACELLLSNDCQDFLPIVFAEDMRVLACITFTTILEHLVTHFREQRRLFDDSIIDLQIGTYTNVISVFPYQSLADALDIMYQHKLSALPVVEATADGKRKLIGVYSRSDITFLTRAMDAEDAVRNLSMPVGDILLQSCNRLDVTTPDALRTCSPSHTLQAIFESFAQLRFNRLYVVDPIDETLIGTVSARDLVSYFIRTDTSGSSSSNNNLITSAINSNNIIRSNSNIMMDDQ